MAFLQLLINYSLILIGAIIFHDNTIAANERNIMYNLSAEYYLPEDIIPKYYFIELELDNITETRKDIYDYHNYTINTETEFPFSGRSIIYIRINSETTKILFHILSEQIRIITCDITKVQSTITYKMTNIIVENDIFTANYNTKILRGNYIVNMTYLGIIPNNGKILHRMSYKEEYKDNTWQVATYIPLIRARGLFPCWDQPIFTASFNIYIKHHSKYIIWLAPSITQRSFAVENDMMWTCFYTASDISTYMLAILIFSPNFHLIPSISDTSSITMWSRQYTVDVIFAQMIAEDVTNFLKSTVKDLGNILKVDQIAIPGFLHDAMDNSGFILYREAAIIYDEELDPSGRKIEVARLIASTIVHQWFGHPTRLGWSPWWPYMRLNKAITLLYGENIIHKVFPDFQILDLFVVQVQHESFHLDTHFFMKPLTSNIYNSSETSVCPFSRHIRAPVLLRMLQHLLPDEDFWKGLEIYFRSHIQMATNVADFLTAMQIGLDTLHYDYELDLKLIMGPWMETNYLPVLKAEVLFQFYTPFLKIEINEVPSNFRIPVTYTTQAELDFSNVRRLNWLMSSQCHVDIPLPEFTKNDFFIVNLKQSGYYRVNYDIRNWNKIANYLNTENYEKIHVLNRAQFIDDAFHLVMSNQLDVDIFFNLTTYLRQEKSYIAWYPMFKTLEYISSVFPFPESKHIKENIRKVLNGVLNKIGYEENPYDDDLTKCLKQEATKWACLLNDLECKKDARNNLIAHFKNPAKHKFLTWRKEWIFCNSIMEADYIAFNEIIYILRQERDDLIADYISCVPFFLSSHIEKFLANKNSSLMTSTNRVKHYLLAISKQIRYDNVFEFTLNNFEILKPKEVNWITSLIVIINHIYNTEQLDVVKKFLRCCLEENTIHSLDYMLTIQIGQFRVIPCNKIPEIRNVLSRKLRVPFESKINIRLLQLESQRNYFKNFMKYKQSVYN